MDRSARWRRTPPRPGARATGAWSWWSCGGSRDRPRRSITMALPEERLRFGAVERALTSVEALPGSRVSWGGVWSGFLVGLGALLLLSMLGLAVGISAVDVGPEPGAARVLGVGA